MRTIRQTRLGRTGGSAGVSGVAALASIKTAVYGARQCGRDRIEHVPCSPREARQQDVEVQRLAIPPDRGEHDRRYAMTDPELPHPGGASGTAPDQKPHRNERERDDDVERPATWRQLGARTGE